MINTTLFISKMFGLQVDFEILQMREKVHTYSIKLNGLYFNLYVKFFVVL